MGVGAEGESDVFDGWCGGERSEVEHEYDDEYVDTEEFESVWCFEF